MSYLRGSRSSTRRRAREGICISQLIGSIWPLTHSWTNWSDFLERTNAARVETHGRATAEFCNRYAREAKVWARFIKVAFRQFIDWQRIKSPIPLNFRNGARQFLARYARVRAIFAENSGGFVRDTRAGRTSFKQREETKGNWLTRVRWGWLSKSFARGMRARMAKGLAHAALTWKIWRQNREITRFVLKHWPPAKKWNRRILHGWLKWHRGHAFLSLALNDDLSIAGLVIARPTMRPPSRDEWYEFDDEGSCLYIDLAISAQPDALKAAGFAILQRFGMRQTVAWRRNARGDALYVYPARSIRRNLFRYLLAERKQRNGRLVI